MRTIILKSLFASSVLLLTSQGTNAEPLPNFNMPTPLWNGQTPIAWGDCVPVPVIPIPQNNFNMGAMSLPQPMMMPQPYPPMVEQPIIPPPSPFFNTSPTPLPLPAPTDSTPQVVCDDTSKIKLESLQARYNQGASASKTKIEELSQSLDDANNQMSDARIIIQSFSKEQNLNKTENINLKKQLTNLDNANKTLQTKLFSAESGAGSQARKITSLNQSAAELVALRSVYKTRNDENVVLKKQLLDLDNTHKSLKTKFGTAEVNAGAQARKLTALGQSATELIALQSAYKSRNDENASLKMKLIGINKEKIGLNSKLKSLQTATTLKGAQDKNTIVALEKKFAALDNTYKSLKAKLGSVEANAGAQARKLTVLGQSATELTALQSAYKARNNENVSLKKKLIGVEKEKNGLNGRIESLQTTATIKNAQDKNTIDALKKKLAALDNTYKSLKTKLGSAEANAGAQARKLTALGQSATELTALQSAYKAKNNESSSLKLKLASISKKLKSIQTSTTLKGTQDHNTIEALKKKLAALDNSHKSLKAKLGTVEANSGSQARKLTALGQSATELVALQSAYKTRNNENAALKDKLANLNETANICKFEVAELKKNLSGSDNERKSLLAKIFTLESKTSDQARKITALTAASLELEGLKSAYKDLSSKKVELSSKLTAATADTDKDGVLNSSDKCPYSLEGAEVDAIGCLADADNDGIANSKDNCPASPVGSHVNEQGCPRTVDTDSDGVADANDLCPTTAAGITVNQFGCEATESINLKGVNFATGSARLTTSSFPIIAAAAKTLKNNPGLKIQISGYTDNQGVAANNERLSQRRANTVMIQLIKDGVDANMLIAKGYGEKSPIASNNTNDGRATNRRVELKIRQ